MEGILLTMFDVRNRLSHMVVQDIQKHFNNRVFNFLIIGYSIVLFLAMYASAKPPALASRYIFMINIPGGHNVIFN